MSNAIGDKEISEAEKGVLASILYYFKEVSDIVDVDTILVDQFVNLRAKRVFQALKATKLVEGRYDTLLVLDKLKSCCLNDQEFQQCFDYLEKLPKDIKYFSIKKYLNFLHENKIKSDLDNLAKAIISKRISSDNFNDTIEQWKYAFNQITDQTTSTNYLSAQEAVEKFQELVSLSSLGGNKVSFLKTLYSDLDRKIKALMGGQLIVIASRPGVGKTTFAINLICNNLSNIPLPKKKDAKAPAIGIFSLEMTRDSLLEKMFSIDSNLELRVVQKLLEGGMIEKYDQELIKMSQEKVQQSNLFFCDEANITIGKIISTIKTWAKEHDLKLVVIDYLQLINFPDDKSYNNMSQHQKIGIISRNLKIISMELNICIVALAQLNRKTDERKGSEKAPILSDLRESGSIEQDADIVLFLYEDQKNNSSDDENFNPSKSSVVTLKIAKNRHGPVGNIDFRFDKVHGTYKLNR